jgi:hypothetical protein
VSRNSWWHQPWVRATETACWRLVVVIFGFAMMVAGLWFAAPSPDVMAPGLTMISVPLGLFLGFAGLAVFMVGLLAHVKRARNER